jgi:uncharacterized protein
MALNQVSSIQLILPIGTKIVALQGITYHEPDKATIVQKGSIGVITEIPTDGSHWYKVTFVNGSKIPIKRQDFTTHKAYQSYMLDGELLDTQEALFDSVIYKCIVGSKAFNLDDADSDTDYKGFYLAPTDLHWSLFGVPEQIDNHETQESYWELQKFIILALKANPNALETLYSPMVIKADPIALELISLRGMFLSKLVYQTYNGYVISQFKKMEQDLRRDGTIRPKHVMHLIRLLISGIIVLKDGEVPVAVRQNRDQLLDIKHGHMSWEDANKWRLDLHKEFDAAYVETTLPDRPDYNLANSFLIQARREQANATYKD